MVFVARVAGAVQLLPMARAIGLDGALRVLSSVASPGPDTWRDCVRLLGPSAPVHPIGVGPLVPTRPCEDDKHNHSHDDPHGRTSALSFLCSAVCLLLFSLLFAMQATTHREAVREHKAG